MGSTTRVHHLSSAGYGAGKSELYDKARFQYVPTQLSYMRSKLPSEARGNLNVAELGAGTGLLTRALLEDHQWNSSITELKCTEPLESMREIFSQNINDPRVSISDGTFEKSSLPDNWADVIFAATAFHWCNDLEAAVQEFKRILKPNGTIIFVWQLEDRDVAWVEQMWQLGMTYQAATGKTIDTFKHWRFHAMFDLPSYKASFHDPEEEGVKYVIPGTVESVTTRFMTWSRVAAQPEDEKKDISEKLKEILVKGEGLTWMDKAEGVFEVPMATPVIVIRRK